MSQLKTLAESMSTGALPREKINNPITLQSTVNGALVTVQKNSIAHAELAQGENGMLVKGYNPNNRTRSFGVGVGFNTDGTIKGREHLIDPSTRVPGNDVKMVSPAMAAVRARGEFPQQAQEQVQEQGNEAEIAEANDRASRAQFETAEANQKLAESEAKAEAMAAEIAALKAAAADPKTATAKQIKKR